MLERYCDALIIGTEISGLITAAFLARRGLTVHVLDLNPYSQNEKEPDPFCVAHLHSKLLRSILGRLNISDNDVQILSGKDSPLQVIFPKKRIDISSNPVTFYEELEREFSNEYENLKLFFERLAHIKHQVEMQQLYSLILPNSFMEKRRLAKFVQSSGLNQKLNDLGFSFDKNPTLKKFILAQLQILTYTHTEAPFAFQVADLLNPSEGEVLSIQGGHHFLRQLFIDRIIHHEGAYRPDAKIEKLLYKNGIFEGAVLSGQEGIILSRYMIWNTYLDRLYGYLPNLLRFRKLKKFIRTLKPSAHWFTASFEVPKEFIPSPMKNNMIVIDDVHEDLAGTNFIYVQLRHESRNVKLSVSYLLEPSFLDKKNEVFESIHKEIQKKLQRLIPFCHEKLRQTFPLSAETENSDTLFPLKDDDFVIFKQNAKSHPVFQQKTKSFSDLFPISFKTPSPNFFLTAPEILNSMGYEGKYMLGLKVTDLIWNDVEKEKKRAMKLEQRIA